MGQCRARSDFVARLVDAPGGMKCGHLLFVVIPHWPAVGTSPLRMCDGRARPCDAAAPPAQLVGALRRAHGLPRHDATQQRRRRLCEAVIAAVLQPHVRPFSRDVRLAQLSAFVEAVLHECDPLGLSAAAWPWVPVAWHEEHSGPDPKP